jgi:hypothetical protein
MTTASPDQPRALIVYESMFGNTEQVARAVSRGLVAAGVPTEVVEVSAAPTQVPDTVELLVLGPPTHPFSLSRPTPRAAGVRPGADAARDATGMREWLHDAHPASEREVTVAVFDTRVSKVRRLPAAAGPKAARLAKGHRFELVGKPVAFLVEDTTGPLLDGELEHAESWGRRLAASARPAAHTG